MSTTTNLSTLKINYLSQSQFDTALDNNQINENEIYMTPTEDMTTQEIQDFVDELNIDGSGTPSEYKKLLWSNPSPTSSFAPQTISCDLSNYDEIEVYGVNYTSYTSNMPPIRISIGDKGNLIGMAGSSGDSAGIGFLVARGIQANTTGVVIAEAKGVSTNGNSWSVNNSNMVPTKIYGIKYERVASPQVDASDYVIEQDTASTTHSTSGTTIWTYRKWNSGIAECWGTVNVPSATYAANGGYKSFGFNFPTGLFNVAPTCLTIAGGLSTVVQTDVGFTHIDNNVYGQSYLINRNASSVTVAGWAYIHVMGTWK